MKERLENLDTEKYCFDFFDGTRMPNSPKFIHITMFMDTFFNIRHKEIIDFTINIYQMKYILSKSQILLR